MKAFGHGGSSIENGDLAHHIGWIEALANDEEGNVKSERSPKARRLAKVRDALQLLNEALEGEQ